MLGASNQLQTVFANAYREIFDSPACSPHGIMQEVWKPTLRNGTIVLAKDTRGVTPAPVVGISCVVPMSCAPETAIKYVEQYAPDLSHQLATAWYIARIGVVQTEAFKDTRPRLLAQSLENMRDREAEMFYLETTSDNEDTVSFFSKIGACVIDSNRMVSIAEQPLLNTTIDPADIIMGGYISTALSMLPS